MGGWEGNDVGVGREPRQVRLKHPFGLKEQRCAFSQTGRIHKGGQDCCEEQFGIPCSPINAPQSHKMYSGGLTASVKTRL